MLTGSVPQPVTYVTAFGAVGNGTTDSGPAIRAALAAAEQIGGSLYFPDGHYMLSVHTTGGAMVVKAGLPLTLAGAGASSVTLAATQTGGPLLGIHDDHTVVQDLTLDTQSTGEGDALYLGICSSRRPDPVSMIRSR